MSHFPDQHEDHQTTPLPFCAPYHQHHKHARHESQTLPLEFHYTESHSDQRSSLSSSSSLSSTTRTPAQQQRQQQPTASEHHVTSSSCLSPPPAPLPIIITTTTPTTPTTIKTASPSNCPVELSTTKTKTKMISMTPGRRTFFLQKRSRIKWWIFFFIVTATCLAILVVGIYVGLRQRG